MGAVIGILGGVGSGKSTVARILARRGLIHVDADAEARAVVLQPEVLRALTERFGPGLEDGQGALDRAELARRAFQDQASTEALNAIVHPAVRRRLTAALDAAGPRPVVLDVPLLLESPLAPRVDHWVFVQAPSGAREERVIRDRAWEAGERQRREARQTALETKRARADRVLENSGTIDDLEGQIDAMLQDLGIVIPSGDGPTPAA